MRLRVVHRTGYQYSAPVVESVNEARLMPASSDGQVCVRFEIQTFPAGKLQLHYDFYRNQVHTFEVGAIHQSLTVEAISEVVTAPGRGHPPETPTCPRADLVGCVRFTECYDFLQSTSLTELTPEVWRQSLDIVGDEQDGWQMALALMTWVHREFAYEPGSTQIKIRIAELLQNRRGVCQDFAHVLLALCRSVKIPARYVSGYLYNGPVDQLRGAQASHAWVEVYLPGFGWRGLDPTNLRQPDEHYVKVAHGRDYGDALPLCGHYKGGGSQVLTVAVNVELMAD